MGGRREKGGRVKSWEEGGGEEREAEGGAKEEGGRRPYLKKQTHRYTTLFRNTKLFRNYYSRRGKRGGGFVYFLHVRGQHPLDREVGLQDLLQHRSVVDHEALRWGFKLVSTSPVTTSSPDSYIPPATDG